VCSSNRWAYWGTHRRARGSHRSARRLAHTPAADGRAQRRTHRPVHRLANSPALCRAALGRSRGLNRTGDSPRGRRRHDHRRGQRRYHYGHSMPHCDTPIDVRSCHLGPEDRSRVRAEAVKPWAAASTPRPSRRCSAMPRSRSRSICTRTVTPTMHREAASIFDSLLS
jgi:hypothetical protein